MKSPLHSLATRGSAATFWRNLAWLSALGVSIAGCKANETAKAPEPAASSEAAAAPAAVEATAEAKASSPAAQPSGNGGEASASIYPLKMKRLDGTETSLSEWSGKVLLIVNTASKCGYTPQYQGLQQLHTTYSGRGFEVLGFPSNDFGGQEPGTAEEISKFCISIYDVNFPMFEKTKTIGQERSALYALLSDAHGEPKWNFHKYLIDKHGRPVHAWPSKVEPGSAELAAAIEAELAAN